MSVLPPTLQFRKETKYGLSYGPFDINSYVSYERILMYGETWAFAGQARGITSGRYTVMDGDRVWLAMGYRCERCHKVFFAAELEDFIHECMEAE